MNIRATVALGALAGSAALAHAQSATWTWDWVHVDPITFQPIAEPANPNSLSPGEAAQIRGSLTLTGIGQTVTNHVGVEGVIGGIGQTNFDVHARPGHDGTFDTTVGRNPAAPGGDPVVDPNGIRIIAVGQLPLPGLPLLYTQSEFENAVTIRWTPDHSNSEPRNSPPPTQFIRPTASSWRSTVAAIPGHPSASHRARSLGAASTYPSSPAPQDSPSSAWPPWASPAAGEPLQPFLGPTWR